MQQLSLALGILPQISQTSTYDPYWDEITQQGDSVGGQPLDPESQIENPIIDEDKSKLSKQTWCEVLWDGWESSNYHCLSDLELAPQQVSPCKPVSGQVNNTTAHQLVFTDKPVSGQVNNTTAHQLVFTDKPVSGQVNNHTNGSAHQLNGWIEKYSVPKNGHKYYYWRFAWREGTKKRRKYIGSCTNHQVKERVRELRRAIALGKNFREILEAL